MARTGAAILLFSSAAFGGMSFTEAEKAYWDCEFMATQGRVDLDTGAGCYDLYERLKKDKFGGDFDRFLAWWRDNKKREMSLRATQGRPRYD